MHSPTNQDLKARPRRFQLILGLIFGVIFGFLLQRGGVTKYDVIIGQLLLEDFTVLKIMLSAIVVGMPGVYAMKTLGWIDLSPKPGSVGASAVGGLIFGIGFAILGYCPGTIAGAVGNGYMDALIGGVSGIWIGAGLFSALYPRLKSGILKKGDFGTKTFPELFRINDWLVVIPSILLILLFLVWLVSIGK